MEIGIFIPSGSQFDNEIPPPHQRKGSAFWSFLTPLLGLQPKHMPWDNEGVSPNIARIREYEARRLVANEPKPPSVAAEIAAELVDHVRTAVKKITKTDRAKAWLAEPAGYRARGGAAREAA